MKHSVKVMKDKARNGKQREQEEGESLLGLIRVIIEGQSVQRQLEGVDVKRRWREGWWGEREMRGGSNSLPHT